MFHITIINQLGYKTVYTKITLIYLQSILPYLLMLSGIQIIKRLVGL